MKKSRKRCDCGDPALPAVAIVANALPPYRVHLHRRIAREMSAEIRLYTLCTHEIDALHAYRPPGEINATSFGPGEPSVRQPKLRYAFAEWRKGGRILRWLADNNVKAVVLNGYNDLGRLRILRDCYRLALPCFIFGDSNVLCDRAAGAKKIAKRLLLRWVLARACGFMACGRLGRRYWEKYGAEPERIFDFPYEPDYDLVTALSAEAIAERRARFGLKEGRRRIVFSGRFVAEKEPALLIDAFAMVALKRPDWDLVMIGAEGAPSRPQPARLKERVPLELAGRVSFTGFVDNQETVSALYRSSDVLCLPSSYEPWGVVVNEAAAAGLAIIASDVVGAAAELVRDRVNGRIVPAGDPKALAEALLEVTEPKRIDRMRRSSPAVLADWRRRGDPVQGLRKALAWAKVL